MTSSIRGKNEPHSTQNHQQEHQRTSCYRWNGPDIFLRCWESIELAACRTSQGNYFAYPTIYFYFGAASYLKTVLEIDAAIFGQRDIISCSAAVFVKVLQLLSISLVYRGVNVSFIL
jgi:hypothetical protein